MPVLKISVTIVLTLFFTAIAFAQKKPNPKIGKKETEITLLILDEGQTLQTLWGLWGIQLVHRWPTRKKYTKIGAGGLITRDQDKFKRGYQPYGSLFGDITQFIGQRQKWSFSGQVGHGIYHHDYNFSGTNMKGFDKYTAGMYYSISANYRMIVSKKMLIIISPFWNLRKLRYTYVIEFFSPPFIEEGKQVEHHQGSGLRIGIVF